MNVKPKSTVSQAHAIRNSPMLRKLKPSLDILQLPPPLRIPLLQKQLYLALQAL